MDFNIENKTCSFCGVRGTKGFKFAGGLGAMMCVPCVEYFYDIFSSEAKTEAVNHPPWERMSDSEILSKLPLIARNAEQVNEFLTEWVELARSRKSSWAEIGKAMGTSRQAAWERFAQRVEKLRSQNTA
ncbi:MAG: hypothetical protein JWR85_3117 [Marmoricola sp.]|nr:hypothetical protein [Marmoricola sp.]